MRCRRPVVTVGGELTLDMLDLAYKPTLKYFEAPLQLKANNGVFIVDDFGRQRLSPQELLNRWIIPLENHQDFLRLRTGQKFAIPFDQFIVFATNLEPRTLMDDAFLRRLRSKVKVDYVTGPSLWRFSASTVINTVWSSTRRRWNISWPVTMTTANAR